MTPIDAALLKAFGEVPPGKHWAWPSLDKGEWAPKSLLIIYHEDGLPDEFTEYYMEKGWRIFEEEISKMFGFPVFMESINSAVSAVWKA